MGFLDTPNKDSIIQNLREAYNWPWPQPHAELCPVCMGKGIVPEGTSTKTCNGCEGKGWVIVG